MQLYQQGLALEKDARYRISFRAYSSKGHDLQVKVQKHGEPYTNYGINNYAINLTTGWADYRVDFIARGFTGTVNDGRLLFRLGPYDAAGDEYFFDDVVLTKLQ